MESIKIESHFELISYNSEENHSIRANTRNKCSQDFVEMLRIVASILYPDENFEIYFLPSEPGGYRDILELVKSNPMKSAVVGTITMSTMIAGTTISYLNYKDSHEEHNHDKKMYIVEDVKNCLELQREKLELEEEYNIVNFPEEKIDEVCQNLDLKKRKNDRYQALKNDDTIKGEETTLKDGNDNVFMNKKVVRENFNEYIEPIVSEEGYVIIEADGFIELLGPILKQRKEGGGIKWKGVYRGGDIVYKDREVFLDGDNIDFYMQDGEFKDKVSKQDITFKNGDNMFVHMRISFFLSDSNLNRKKVYVEKVERFNEDVIEHKVKIVKKSNVAKNQLPLI